NAFVKSFLLACLLLGASSQCVRADFIVSQKSKARCIIVQSTNATITEIHAARELAVMVAQITGRAVEVNTNSRGTKEAGIVIGPGEAARALFPEMDLDALGPEEFVMRVKGNHLLLAGGRPRGTMYAVNRFLQEQCGVRWWTPWATNVPHRATLLIPELN